MNKEEMIEEIKKMTVVELADLVKAIEEEFGVSAAAVAAPAAGAAATAAAALTPNFSSIALTKSKSSTTVMLSRALIMSSLESAIIINYPPMAFDSTRQQGLQLLQLHPASSQQ